MAMKHATEYVRGLRCKLRSMGIPVEECVYIYGDNQSVLVNSGSPHSQLKKKSKSVAFHHVRRGSALDEWRITYINTHDNIADLMTKNLASGAKIMKFCEMLLNFLKPSIEIGEEAGHHAAAAALKAIPSQWMEAIVGTLMVWETELTAAQA